MQTGENEQGLRKIMDLTRGLSILVLLLHFYYYCFRAFRQWGLVYPVTARIMIHIGHTGIFTAFNKSKYFSLLLLAVSLIGASGSKDEKVKYKKALVYLIAGLAFYFSSYYVLILN